MSHARARSRRGARTCVWFPVIASEAKQSSFVAALRKLDCFVASLLAMTVERPSGCLKIESGTRRGRDFSLAPPLRGEGWGEGLPPQIPKMKRAR